MPHRTVGKHGIFLGGKWKVLTIVCPKVDRETHVNAEPYQESSLGAQQFEYSRLRFAANLQNPEHLRFGGIPSVLKKDCRNVGINEVFGDFVIVTFGREP